MIEVEEEERTEVEAAVVMEVDKTMTKEAPKTGAEETTQNQVIQVKVVTSHNLTSDQRLQVLQQAMLLPSRRTTLKDQWFTSPI
jgi:hypothetical protein